MSLRLPGWGVSLSGLDRLLPGGLAEFSIMFLHAQAPVLYGWEVQFKKPRGSYRLPGFRGSGISCYGNRCRSR